MSTSVTSVTRWVLTALVVVPAMALAACGSAAGPDSTAGKDGDSEAIIRVNNVEPVSDLTPSKVTDTAGWKVVTQLFDGLVTFSPQGQLIYDNAQSITPNADASSYTVKLKAGLQFSNGEAITASTYAKTWSYAANAANGQTGGSIFSTIAGYPLLQDPQGPKDALLEGLHVVDDLTLQVDLAAPDSSFPYKVGDVSFLPLPSVAYQDMAAFGRHPIGNGPYIFVSWTPNQSIRLGKNPNYRGPRQAHNGGISFVDYQSLDTAYADLEAGNLDLLDSVPVSALATYRSDSLIQSFSQPGPAFKSLTIPWGLEHFQGQEGALRRAAISRSIDRKEVADKVFRGSVTPASDFTAPTIAGYSRSLAGSEVLQVNRQEARKLWQQADAISPWSGTFEIAYSGDGSDKDWVDALTHAIHESLGIEARSSIFPSSKEFKTAVNQRLVHSAFASGRQSDYPYPEGYLVEGYASSAADGKGLNYADYKNPAFDRLIDQAARSNNQEQAIDYYHQAQEQLLRDLPAIPLWYTKVSAGASKQLTHVSFNYMGLPSYHDLRKSDR